MNGIKVSIIVPVYNVEKYLEKCLDSIVKQTYENIEIILVDDGSTDKSGTILDQYAEMDNRISVIHKKNEGVSTARNTGIEAARGEYICFADADDYLMPDYVEYLLTLAVDKNADIAIKLVCVPPDMKWTSIDSLFSLFFIKFSASSQYVSFP